MKLQIITLAEILRDFLQYIYIVVSALGNHISLPTKMSFIQIYNWLSLDLYKTIDIRMSFTMFAQLLLLIFCSGYLFALTLQQIKRNILGQDGQTYAEVGSFMKFFNLITIFIITTLFQPITNNSLSIWFNDHDEIEEEEKLIMKILSISSLFIIIVIIPVIFIKGIISSRPEKNKFDKKGGKQMSQREIYQEYLAKTQTPFKSIFREYSYEGAYFKLIVMIYKFAQLVIMFDKPSPSKGYLGFIIKYSIFGILTLSLFMYIYKVRPYLDNRLNTMYIASILATLWCLACNVALYFLDNSKATDYQMQLMFSVFQIIGCVLIFFLNFFNIILFSFPFVIRMLQKLNSQLIFTEVKKRGKNIRNIVGLKQNRYLRYVIFNPNVYDKNTEISINIWQDFWINLIQTDPKFKTNIKLHNLVFVNQHNTTPYLKNFGGKVEERFEENTRILQKIGRQKYEEELIRLENPEYKKLILFIYRDISPLDSYYESEEKQVSGFCKVVFFPFPMMLQLYFDNSDKIIELSGFDDLNDFYQLNMRQDIMEKRLLRTKIRALNGLNLDFTYTRKLAFKKGQESDIRDISKSVDMDVQYQYGKFIVQSDMTTKFKVPHGPTIDVGKGLRCYLSFQRGIGQSIDGRVFRAPPITLNNEDLQLDLLDNEESIINQIIQKNQSIWQTELRKVQDYIDKYKMSMIGNFLLKQKVLSYGFNLNVFSAPYENIIDRELIYKELKKEMNFDLEILSEKEKYKFICLYEIIELCDKSDFFAYQYLLFKDIWNCNKDISIIQKNEDLINPDKPTCIIYHVDKTLNEWREIFYSRGLRKSNGRGYFNDRIFENINSMLKLMNDTPKEMLFQSLMLQEGDFSQKNSSQFDRSSKFKDLEKNLPPQIQSDQILSLNNSSKEKNEMQQENQKSNKKSSENPSTNHNSILSNGLPISKPDQSNRDIDVNDSKFQNQKSNSPQNESYQKSNSLQVDSKEDNLLIKKQDHEKSQDNMQNSQKEERVVLGQLTNNINLRSKSSQISANEKQMLNSKQSSSSSQKEMGTQTVIQIYSNEESRVKKYSLSSLLNRNNSIKLDKKLSSSSKEQNKNNEENQKGLSNKELMNNQNIDLNNKQDSSNQENISGNNISFNNLSDKQFFEGNNSQNQYQHIDDLLEQKNKVKNQFD